MDTAQWILFETFITDLGRDNDRFNPNEILEHLKSICAFIEHAPILPGLLALDSSADGDCDGDEMMEAGKGKKRSRTEIEIETKPEIIDEPNSDVITVRNIIWEQYFDQLLALAVEPHAGSIWALKTLIAAASSHPVSQSQPQPALSHIETFRRLHSLLLLFLAWIYESDSMIVGKREILCDLIVLLCSTPPPSDTKRISMNTSMNMSMKELAEHEGIVDGGESEFDDSEEHGSASVVIETLLDFVFANLKSPGSSSSSTSRNALNRMRMRASMTMKSNIKAKVNIMSRLQIAKQPKPHILRLLASSTASASTSESTHMHMYAGVDPGVESALQTDFAHSLLDEYRHRQSGIGSGAGIEIEMGMDVNINIDTQCVRTEIIDLLKRCIEANCNCNCGDHEVNRLRLSLRRVLARGLQSRFFAYSDLLDMSKAVPLIYTPSLPLKVPYPIDMRILGAFKENVLLFDLLDIASTPSPSPSPEKNCLFPCMQTVVSLYASLIVSWAATLKKSDITSQLLTSTVRVLMLFKMAGWTQGPCSIVHEIIGLNVLDPQDVTAMLHRSVWGQVRDYVERSTSSTAVSETRMHAEAIKSVVIDKIDKIGVFYQRLFI